MTKIGTEKNKTKTIIKYIFVIAAIFAIGYLIGFYGIDFIKKM